MADKEYPQGRTIHYSGGLEDSADKKKKDNYKRAATLMEQGKEGEAIDIFRKTLDLDPTISERAALFVLIGNCHVALGEMDQAASRYRGAESSAKQARDTEGAAAVTANLGLINHVNGELDQALEMYDGALNLERAIGNRSGAATILTNTGLAYWQNGELKASLDKINRRHGEDLRRLAE